MVSFLKPEFTLQRQCPVQFEFPGGESWSKVVVRRIQGIPNRVPKREIGLGTWSGDVAWMRHLIRRLLVLGFVAEHPV